MVFISWRLPDDPGGITCMHLNILLYGEKRYLKNILVIAKNILKDVSCDNTILSYSSANSYII